MSNLIEGKGYLFHGSRLLSPVRYRLRWTRDGWGRGSAEGELLMLSSQPGELDADSLVLHTEDGFSVPLEQAGRPDAGWRAFRRLPREEVAHDLG